MVDSKIVCCALICFTVVVVFIIGGYISVVTETAVNKEKERKEITVDADIQALKETVAQLAEENRILRTEVDSLNTKLAGLTLLLKATGVDIQDVN